jgi:hypothetical protein
MVLAGLPETSFMLSGVSFGGNTANLVRPGDTRPTRRGGRPPPLARRLPPPWSPPPRGAPPPTRWPGGTTRTSTIMHYTNADANVAFGAAAQSGGR